MRLLGRYIGRVVGTSTLTVMGVLIAVFSFFHFIDELDDIGQGRYGVAQAVQFVLLTTPRLTYELFPIGALIGTLAGLGSLVSNSEMTVIRTAGVSVPRIILAAMKAALVIMVMAVIVGELIMPPSEQLAQFRRSLAISDHIALRTRNGFWARDGHSYVNIRKLLPGDRVEDIYIYEFDTANRLKTSTYAKGAHYAGGRWLLEDIDQTTFQPEKLTQRHITRARWESLLDPHLVNIVVIKPNSLSIWDLYEYIGFLKSNGQNSQQYEQALWLKLVYPLATGVMVFLAIPIVLRTPRPVAVGHRVVLGSCIGLAFHIVNKAAGNLGVVFNLYPALSVAFPTLLTFAVGLVLMRRVA